MPLLPVWRFEAIQPTRLRLAAVDFPWVESDAGQGERAMGRPPVAGTETPDEFNRTIRGLPGSPGHAMSGMTRAAPRTEPGQMMRLVAFKTAHPDVLIGPGEFDTWQAVIPEPSGETYTARATLRELLDRLDELTAGQ
jgi:hypothetical protein